VKYYCEACERLVPPAAFRIENGLLVLKCSRCKVEMRGEPEQDVEFAALGAAKPVQAPVIMLAGSDAEPDPIEDEPTRRIAVPASILAAIETEAQEVRRKKEAAAREPVSEKSPAPVPTGVKAPTPEPVVAKSPAPEPAKTPPPKMMSEAAAANLVVLRLADVQARTEPKPVAESMPARPASASAEDPFMPPAGYCPKCIGVRKEDAAVCPYCGLDFARFRIEELRPSPVLSSTWLGVLELWESRGAHDKVLALASEKGELAMLGRLYRIRLARSPEDAQAKRGREEVLRLAAAASTFMPSAPLDKGAKIRTTALGLLFFLLVLAAVIIIYQARRVLMEP